MNVATEWVGGGEVLDKDGLHMPVAFLKSSQPAWPNEKTLSLYQPVFEM